MLAEAAIEAGYPEAAAASVICLEWLQRPENVLAGCIRWADDRGCEAPTAICIGIVHHKTNAVVLHGWLGRLDSNQGMAESKSN
jgi:hypothetical protein